MYVDQRALRVDRVTVLERGAPNSVCLLESGKVLPDVRVAIVHPDTKVPCAHTDLGEVSLAFYDDLVPFPSSRAFTSTNFDSSKINTAHSNAMEQFQFFLFYYFAHPLIHD